MAESHGFTMDSARRIARTVIEWERSTSSSGEREPRPKRSTRGELPNWNAIAKADIASETLGVVQLADANRATAGTDEITGYNGGPAIAAGRPVIVFPMALPRYDGGEPVNWQIVDPNPQCGSPPILDDLDCGNLQTDTTSKQMTANINAALFEAIGGDDMGYLAQLGGALVYSRPANAPGSLCQWDVPQVDGEFNYSMGRTLSTGPTDVSLVIRQYHAEAAPYYWDIRLASDALIAPYDGLASYDLKYSSLLGNQPSKGVKLLDTVQVGDVVATAGPHPSGTTSGTYCEILSDHSEQLTDLTARVEAIESLLGIGPVNP